MSDIAQNRARKTSNSQASTMDYSDLASDGETTPRMFPPVTQYQALDAHQGSWTGVDTPRRRTPHNVLPDKENNITKMPDRNQVVTRLNQISDYIKQTSTLMDTLKNSGEPRHLAQHVKMSKMVADLRDSEAKLQLMLPGLDEPATSETESEGHHSSHSSHSQSRSSSIQAMFQTASRQSPGRGSMDDLVKSTLSSRQNQLQKEVEKSQRNLQALEDHQRAIVSLQQEAHQQLIEARAAQGELMTQESGDAGQGEGLGLQGSMQQLQERLLTLQDLYENRNKLATMLGDNDEQLAPEHTVLQDKLQELQSKKQQMDHLLAQFKGAPCPVSHSDHLGLTRHAEDDDSEGSELDTDHSMLQAKISELNAMKTQLAQLQVLMLAVRRAETPGSGEGEVMEPEDQAVNLRKQKRENNITQASTPNSTDHTRRIEEKSLKLQETKAHLQELQDLLATVTDLHSRGEQIPEQFLQRLVDETTQAESPGSRRSAERRVPQPELTLEMGQAMSHDVKHQTTSLQEERDRLQLGKMQRYLPLREKKTNTQMDSQTHQQQLLQTELRAKRRELEELMRKDQGQSSVNQDVCSETSVDKSDTPGYSLLTEATTTATWGGSTQDTLGDMVGQDPKGRSAGYSSEDGGDEEDEDGAAFVGRQLNNSTRDGLNQTVNTNRDVLNMSLESVRLSAGNPAPSSHSNATNGMDSMPVPPQAGDQPNTQGPHNLWRKPSTDSSIHLPRAVWTPQDRTSSDEQINSNVNAVPPSGWCQQQAFTLQQQLEVTSAMCQRMLSTPGAVNPFQPIFPLDNYQPLLLANQLQQQQALLSTVNQCCQLLWLQQCELAALKLSVQGLQEKSHHQNPGEGPMPQGPHPNLKLSYSGGLLQPPSSCSPSGGVTGAQSLPNLSQGPPGDFPLGFSAALNNAPLVSLLQPPPGASWLQPGGGHVTPQALNNQVPPGNRTNNYWDNFRSYSRQNLLSSSAKSNEGASHSPSPLVDRSRNSLQGCMPQHQEALQGTDGARHNALAPHAEGMQGSEGSLAYRAYNPGQDCMAQHSEPSHVHLVDRSHNLFRGYLAPHSEVLNNEGATHSPLMGRSDNSFRGCVSPHSEVLKNEGASHSPLMERSPISFRSCFPLHSEVLNNEGAGHIPLMDRSHNSFRGCVVQRSSESNDSSMRSCITSLLQPSPSTSAAAYHRLQDKSILSYNMCRKEKMNTDCRDDRCLVNEGTLCQEQATSNAVNSGHQDIRSLVAAEMNGSETCTSTAPHNKLCYSVYAEVAALIAANENRPHFLIQLFRDLQMVSSDPLRQRTLQSIHEVVRQLPAHNPALVEESASVEITASEVAVSSDDEDISTTEMILYRLGEPSLATEELQTGAQEEASQERAGSPFSELPAASSSPKELPCNAVWATDDLPLRLPERSSKMDWEVEGVLVDLLPFLRSHVEDTCTPLLLETVRKLTLQLIPAQNLPAPRPLLPARLGCIYQGQLDALLEDALLKFQGSRLQDVGEELLTVVSEVLLSELTFLRLVDTVGRADNTVAPQPETEAAAPLTVLAVSSTQQATCLGEYNGDLAEADQSHQAASQSGASNMQLLQVSSEETEGGAMEGETEPCHDDAGRGNSEHARELDRVPTRLSPVHSSSPLPIGPTDTTRP